MPKVVQHVVAPGYEQARGLPLVGETIQDFLVRVEWDFKVPTICVCNGEPILRAEWAVMPADFGDITFVSRPHGGGASSGANKGVQVAGIVGMIALAAAAPWAAGLLAPVLGITSTAAISGLAAGIALGGGMLISTLVKLVAGGQNSTGIADATQVYSLQGATNSAKPLGVIPVNYGTQKIIPDYGSQPWSEYISNNQFLNTQLTIGVGKHRIDQILLEDTILWDSSTGINPIFNTSDVQIEFCPPGTPITLFPTNIEQSVEVSGQELPGPTSPGFYLGGFVANASGTQTYKLVADVAFSGGLYFVDANNNYSARTVNFTFWYRLINDAGTPISGWVGNAFQYTDMTKTPVRLSFIMDPPPGRYEVRGNRDDLPNGASLVANIQPGSSSPGAVSYTIQQNTGKVFTAQDQCNWIGLRAYIVGSANYEHEYNIAIRMMADEQLSSQAARSIGVICTRILPVWNGSALVDTPTKNPLWAFWDAATNTLYGAKRPITKVDFNAILLAAQAADARGDSFNYSFKDFVTVPEALDTILAPARSKHCWIGDILSLVRDEWRNIPTMLLTDNQIVRGTLEVTSIFNDETGVDAIIGEFLNENTWRPAEIQFPPNTMSFSASNPSRIRISGVTDPEQMLREVGFIWNQSQLRRTKVSLSTGHEGRILKLMSAINVQSHLPRSWGLSGEVVSLDVDGVTLTLNRDISTTLSGSDTNYVEFRDKRGRYFGPIICGNSGADHFKILLNASDLAIVEADQGMTIEQALDRMDGAEPPVFVLGQASNISRSCMLLQAKPNGDTVDLLLVVDSLDVHDGSFGDVGDFPEPPAILNPQVPVVTLLTAIFRVGTAEPILDASWWPAVGAIDYVAQVSYNGGSSWQGIYEGTNPGLSSLVNPVELILRVQAISTMKGPWTQVTVKSPTISLAPNSVSPVAMKLGLREYVMSLLKENDDVAANIRQIIAAAVAELDAHHYSNQQELRRNLVSVFGDASASFEELITVATGPGSAIATDITNLTATVGDLSSTVTINAAVVADISGHLAAAWGITLDVNHYVTGMQFLNDGTTSAVVFNTDNFSIAKPGILTPTTIFALQTVNGVTTMALRGNFIADGTVTTNALLANSVTASKIGAGEVQAIHIAAVSIDSSKIAINGVDILNIIAGAVTQQTTAGTIALAQSGATNRDLGSATMVIKSGTASVIWTADIIASNSVAFAVTTSVTLFRNGSAIKTWTWNVPASGQIQNPFTFWFDDVGLGVGNYTYLLRSTGNAAFVGFGSGIMRVQDLRR